MNFGNVAGDAGLENDFLPEIFAKFRRHKVFILSWSLFLFGFSIFCLQLWPKTYQGIASIQVLSQTARVAGQNLISGGETFTDETAGTELAILRSRELMVAVIDRLHLMQAPEFNPDLKPGITALVTTWARNTPLAALPERWIAQVAAMLPEDLFQRTPDSAPPSDFDRQQFDTIERFKALVTVAPVSHSKIIEVTASSQNRVLSAKIANAVVDEYIAMHRRMKDDLLLNAHQFTTSRLPELRKDMLAKNALVDQFRREHNLVSGQVGPIMRERLTEATKQLADARSALGRLEASLAASRNNIDPLSIPEVLASLTIQNLRTEEAKAAEDVNFANVFQRDRLKLKRDAVEAQIVAEARRVIASLPKAVASAQQNVTGQMKAVTMLEEQVGVMETQQSQLANLQQDADLARKQYNRYAEDTADTQQPFADVDVKAVSAAGVPFKAAFPNMTYAVPAAFLLSLLTMAALTLYRERHNGLRSSLTIENMFNFNVIGKIPLRGKAIHEAMYASAIEELCTHIFPPWVRDQRKTVLITSPMPHDGKTTISRALGEAAASRGISVVILDADMRVSQPGRGSRSPVDGLGDVLASRAAIDDIMVRLPSGLVFVPSGTARSNPTRLLALPSLPNVIQQLQANFQLVIIDSPPASVGGDVLTLSHHVTEVLVVVNYGNTLASYLRATLDKIQPSVETRATIQIAINRMPVGGSATEEIVHSRDMMRYYRPQRMLH